MQQREVTLTAANSHLLQIRKQKIYQAVNKVLQHFASHFVKGLQVLTSGYEMEVWVNSIYTQVHFYVAVFSKLLFSGMQMLNQQIITPALLPYAELVRNCIKVFPSIN